MTDDILIEVVRKLIGNVCPVGETHEDNKRIENLATLGKLTECLIMELVNIERRKSHHMYSVARAGKKASEIMSGIAESIEEQQ